MLDLRNAAWSSVGKKLITGITGLALVAWITAHLIGNVTLYLGAEAFNAYAHLLENLGHGLVLPLMEMGLLAFFAMHIVSGISVWRSKRRARPIGYASHADAGGPSKKTRSSQSMLYSGLLLLVYIVLHVRHFKYGDTAMVMVHGTEVRDLYSLVVAEFNKPLVVAAYVGGMAFLGAHLRHGVWSMLQSLGLLNKRWLPFTYSGAVLVAGALAIGFLLLPLWVYFFLDAPAATAALGVLR
jgi:succinate dehydrogenase / fumarate reductase cytochrome b subunit